MNGLKELCVLGKLFSAAKSKAATNRQSIKSIAALFGSNATSSLLSAIGGLLIARFIGPDVNGLFRSFTIPLTYLTFLHLGTFDGLWRQIPFYTGKNEPEKVAAVASAANAWNVFISIIVSCAFVAVALYQLYRGNLTGLAGWLVQACATWFVFYGGYLGATYRTIHQFTALARIQLIQTFLNFGLVFITPFLAFYGLCIRAACVSVAGVMLCHRHRPLRVPLQFNKAAFKELVAIGLPFSMLGSLYTSIWVATESALMLAYGGVQALGLFSVAVVVREGMNVLPQAVHQVLMPRIVERYAANGEKHTGQKQLWIITALTTALMIMLALAFSVVIDFIVPVAIPLYVEGIPLIKLCLWFSVVQAAGLPMNSLFATGDWWVYGRDILPAFVIFLLCTYTLNPIIGGILAVIAGSLIGRCLRTVLAYVQISLQAAR